MKSSRSEPSKSSATCIGLLSDSHGEFARTQRAVERLVARGATCFIHCGDLEDPRCLDSLAGLNAHICCGNCDEPSDFEGYAQSLDMHFYHRTGLLTIDGARIAFMHGDDSAAFELQIAANVGWLFHGHSHLARDVVIRGTRVVNPGALYRAKPFSVALVTPAHGDVEFLTIGE